MIHEKAGPLINVSMNIIKKDSETNESIAGAKFGLYANEDIINYNGKVIVKAGTLLETSVSDENGVCESSKLMYGTYYFKEVKAPNGYIRDDNTYQFNIKIKKLSKEKKLSLNRKYETIKLEKELIKRFSRNQLKLLIQAMALLQVTYLVINLHLIFQQIFDSSILILVLL